MSSELTNNEAAIAKLPCGVTTVEQLENLVRGTLSPELAVEVAAHADYCPVCIKELAWLRAETELFAQRARGVPPSKVWSQVEAQLSHRLAAQLASQKPTGGRWHKRLRSQSLQWIAVGAAAAVMGIVAASPLSPLRLRDSLHGLLGRPLAGFAASTQSPQSTKGAAMLSHFDDYDGEDGGDHDDDQENETLTAQAAVSGPTTVGVETRSGDIEVVAGKAGEVLLTATETDAHAVKLVDKGKGRLQAEFDGSVHAGSGQLRLVLPSGSGLEVKTISGDVVISEVHGDVVVRSVSGDVHVRGAAKVTVNTTSGEALIERASGAVMMETTSGDLLLRGDVAAPVKFTSTSGDLQIQGACKAGCQVSATTTSGDVSVPAKKASLSARLRSRSGEISGAEGLAIEMRRRPREKSEWVVHVGKSEGRLELDSESGGINLGLSD